MNKEQEFNNPLRLTCSKSVLFSCMKPVLLPAQTGVEARKTCEAVTLEKAVERRRR